MNATFVQNNMALKTIQAKAGPSPSTVELTSLFGNYMRVRTRTEALVMTLSAEDMVVQSNGIWHTRLGSLKRSC